MALASTVVPAVALVFASEVMSAAASSVVFAVASETASAVVSAVVFAGENIFFLYYYIF